MDIYNSKIARVLAKINRAKAYAITVSSITTLYSCGYLGVGINWRKHEDCHKRQIADEGVIKFFVKYLFFSITKGYQSNPYECEARLAENAN